MDPNSLPSTSSSSPPNHHRHLQTRFKVTQPVADRIVRALRHRLRLLHRSGPDFYVLGATANVYTVSLSSTATATACTCPDRTSPCKHILFVLIRALRVPLSHPSLRRRSLRPCHLARLLASPTAPESLAGPALREKFHQLFFGANNNNNNRHDHHDHLPQKPANDVDNVEDGATCPVCLEEMVEKERVVACGTCRNPVHEECLLRWKRSSGRRSASCVICRARWRDHHHQQQQQERYLNLSAYVSEEEEAAAAAGGGGGGDDGLCVDLARLRGRLD